MLLLDRIAALAQVARQVKSYAKPHTHGTRIVPLALSVMAETAPGRRHPRRESDSP
jgi:hypothetical protein